jgi:SAM-dependent methyltransferase
MARHVAPGGHVHGVDVNEPFLARASDVARAAGVGDSCTFHHLTGDRLPLDRGTVHRAIAKNVLEYVPDLAATLGEVVRVLAPGGRLVAMDSDWGFVVVEPLSPDEVTDLFRAAAPAFREPFIGRKLRAAFGAAGLTDVQVNVVAATDAAGRTRGILENMVNYGLTFGRLTAERATELRTRLDAAIADGTFLVVLPQFVVTGTKA